MLKIQGLITKFKKTSKQVSASPKPSKNDRQRDKKDSTAKNVSKYNSYSPSENTVKL